MVTYSLAGVCGDLQFGSVCGDLQCGGVCGDLQFSRCLWRLTV